jgi:hypothetical protein
LKQLKSLAKARPWAKDHEDVQRAITYFESVRPVKYIYKPAGGRGTMFGAAS